MASKWRDAATVILTSLRTGKKTSNFNYDLLSIKRSDKNSFMPGRYVFPGGTTHAADSSREWLDMFSQFGLEVNSNMKHSPPGLIGSVDDLPKLISMKITAVRETFEETGVLLCRKDNTDGGQWASNCNIEDSGSWRLKVEKDASQFITLCKHFKCCPDINNLHLWSNWLTPRSKPKRFDTFFFIASLTEQPSSLADKDEIDEIVWSTPKEVLEMNEQNSIILPPPQIYEISRLLHFPICSDLVSFARDRAGNGCERWMPLYIKTLDGEVSLLPGDDAYSVDDYDGLNVPLTKVEMTREEFRSKSKVHHRFEGKKIVATGYNSKYGHVVPIS